MSGRGRPLQWIVHEPWVRVRWGCKFPSMMIGSMLSALFDTLGLTIMARLLAATLLSFLLVLLPALGSPRHAGAASAHVPRASAPGRLAQVRYIYRGLSVRPPRGSVE